MIVLVTGGSGCGKSTWAEKLVSALPAEKRVYIATMQVYDEESVQRVARIVHSAQTRASRPSSAKKTLHRRTYPKAASSCWKIWST